MSEITGYTEEKAALNTTIQETTGSCKKKGPTFGSVQKKKEGRKERTPLTEREEGLSRRGEKRRGKKTNRGPVGKTSGGPSRQ